MNDSISALAAFAAFGALALVPLQATAGRITIGHDAISCSALDGAGLAVAEPPPGAIRAEASGVPVFGGSFRTLCREYEADIGTRARPAPAASDGSRPCGGTGARTASPHTPSPSGALQRTTNGGASATALRNAVRSIERDRSFSQIGGDAPEAYRTLLSSPGAIDAGRRTADVRVLTQETGPGETDEHRLVMVGLPPAVLATLGLIGGLVAIALWRRERAALEF